MWTPRHVDVLDVSADTRPILGTVATEEALPVLALVAHVAGLVRILKVLDQLAVSETGWMNGVLGHFYALSRLNWARDNLG